jgi:hypothetical protein
MHMKKILFILLVLFTGQMNAQPPQIPIGTVFPTLKTPVHDPVMIRKRIPMGFVLVLEFRCHQRLQTGEKRSQFLIRL